jgi:hypothetical protein
MITESRSGWIDTRFRCGYATKCRMKALLLCCCQRARMGGLSWGASSAGEWDSQVLVVGEGVLGALCKSVLRAHFIPVLERREENDMQYKAW